MKRAFSRSNSITRASLLSRWRWNTPSGPPRLLPPCGVPSSGSNL
jgi:hypothetical protein